MKWAFLNEWGNGILPRRMANQPDSEPLPRGRSRASPLRCSRSSSSAGLLHRCGKPGEEIIGRLLGRAVDQPLPELGELATDLRFHVVGEKRAAILIRERDLGAAFREAGGAALPFAGNAIAVGRIEIGEPHLALPARLDRS